MARVPSSKGGDPLGQGTLVQDGLAQYALGHGAREIRRLEQQADLLLPATLRLLESCGLRPGMSVLDIGTGAGDVALLAARMVGAEGRVVGIDRSADVLVRARERAAGQDQVRFEEAGLDELASDRSFDLVICRYVLVHQPDQVGFLRRAAGHVRRHGRLAVLELATTEGSSTSVPPLPVYERILADVRDAFSLTGSDLGVGLRLVDLFAEAGLPEPKLFAEQLVGGAASSLPEWIVEVWNSVVPMLTRVGRSPRLAPDGLLHELRTAAHSAHAQFFGPRNVAAWVTLA